MALPKEPVKLSTFHGGMAPDLGQVVGGLPETAEDLLNVEIQKDGAIRVRPEYQHLTTRSFEGPGTNNWPVEYEDITYWGVANFLFKSRNVAGELVYVWIESMITSSGDINTTFNKLLTPDIQGLQSSTVIGSSTNQLGAAIRARRANKLRIVQLRELVMVLNPYMDPQIYMFDPSTETFMLTTPFPSTGRISVRHPETNEIVGINTLEYPDDTPQQLATRRKFMGAVAYGQRLWYFGFGTRPNTIFISRTVRDLTTVFADGLLDSVRCYVEDPLNPVATDGGFIEIFDADEIIGLIPYKTGLLIMATNGIWLVTSEGPAVFNATNHSISRIAELGPVGYDTFTIAEDTVVFLAESGVYAVGLHESGQLAVQPVSRGRTDTIWASIDSAFKRAAGMAYDRNKRQIIIAITDQNLIEDAEARAFRVQQEYDFNPYQAFLHAMHMYIFDIDLNAWWRYKIGDGQDNTQTSHKVYGISQFLHIAGNLSLGETIHAAKDYVLPVFHDVARDSVASFASQYNFLISVAERFPGGKDFRVLGEEGGASVGLFSIKAHVLSHPLTFDNLSNKKLIHFLHMALGRVETGTIEDGIDINPGGMRLTAGWDWFKPGASDHPKARQTYNPYRWTETTFGGFDQNKPVIKDKFKLPGRGIAVQLLITNQDADDNYRDFHLKGWQVEVKGSARR